MRHADREITELSEILKVLDHSTILRIAINDSIYPYIIPMHFSYSINEDCLLTFYMHSSLIGKKIDLIKKNNRVCFEMDIFYEFSNKSSRIPCQWSTIYESIIGNGQIEIITEEKEKKIGMDSIMNRLGGGRQFVAYDSNAMQKVSILRLITENITGKRHLK